VHARAGPYKCTPLSFTAPGGSGCILANAGVPKVVTDLVTQARQGSSSFLYINADGVLRHPTMCEAAGCGAAAGDPYHFMLECSHAAGRAAHVAARNGVVSIVRGILDRVKDLCARLPERLAAPVAAMLPPIQAAIDGMPPTHALWSSATGKAIIVRISLAQPWAAQDLPPAIIDDGDAGALALALGVLFDSINLPPYLTRALCTQWASKASRIVCACNAARDLTHARPTWRRGGQQHQRAVAASAAEQQEDAEAAAFHGAAEAYLSTHGALPPARPPARRRRAPRGARARVAAVAAAEAAAAAAAAAAPPRLNPPRSSRGRLPERFRPNSNG